MHKVFQKVYIMCITQEKEIPQFWQFWPSDRLVFVTDEYDEWFYWRWLWKYHKQLLKNTLCILAFHNVSLSCNNIGSGYLGDEKGQNNNNSCNPIRCDSLSVSRAVNLNQLGAVLPSAVWCLPRTQERGCLPTSSQQPSRPFPVSASKEKRTWLRIRIKAPQPFSSLAESYIFIHHCYYHCRMG